MDSSRRGSGDESERCFDLRLVPPIVLCNFGDVFACVPSLAKDIRSDGGADQDGLAVGNARIDDDGSPIVRNRVAIHLCEGVELDWQVMVVAIDPLDVGVEDQSHSPLVLVGEGYQFLAGGISEEFLPNRRQPFGGERAWAAGLLPQPFDNGPDLLEGNLVRSADGAQDVRLYEIEEGQEDLPFCLRRADDGREVALLEPLAVRRPEEPGAEGRLGDVEIRCRLGN